MAFLVSCLVKLDVVVTLGASNSFHDFIVGSVLFGCKDPCIFKLVVSFKLIDLLIGVCSISELRNGNPVPSAAGYYLCVLIALFPIDISLYFSVCGFWEAGYDDV